MGIMKKTFQFFWRKSQFFGEKSFLNRNVNFLYNNTHIEPTNGTSMMCINPS